MTFIYHGGMVHVLEDEERRCLCGQGQCPWCSGKARRVTGVQTIERKSRNIRDDLVRKIEIKKIRRANQLALDAWSAQPQGRLHDWFRTPLTEYTRYYHRLLGVKDAK